MSGNNLGDTLAQDSTLRAEDHLVSGNGAWRLVLQGDGNLVLQATGDGSVRWASNTSNAVRLEMQASDGNLVLYAEDGTAVWSSETVRDASEGPFKLTLQDDGNAVVYAQGNALWGTGPQA